MQPKFNKAYKTRNGRRVTLRLDPNPNEAYPIIARFEDGGESFLTKEGSFYHRHGIHDHDLIEEWVNPPDEIPPLKLEVGKSYRTRQGKKARVVCMDRKYVRPVVALIEEDSASQPHEVCTALSLDGKYKPDGESQYDLVAEWSDKPVFDRSLLPKWANRSIAQDADLRWFCYSHVPTTQGGHSWAVAGHTCSQIPASHAPQWTGDWKDSLLVFED